ncbi:4Fe-4S binding protein [Paucibacter sp. TC2R-5]|uniref:4Fe-4S binding protein n=1 Tax=Paucibacter sp. TC2R-5 TaxID=2893555 RepID=UPI0021E40A34|nr:4Fe-4S binding protein [Paucibacter sp. TC2R-5]MCV2358849.1 4Fe-4S binding protein [Paucibacter sp. TC2R-5]
MADTPQAHHHSRQLQRRRRVTQGCFFALFLLAPALNLLRFDLNETQLWVLGQPWSLGIDALQRGQVSANEAAISLILRGILPGLALVALFLGVAWRWGRLYCGWLCPHFSLVEGLNALLHKACGKFSLWDAQPSLRPGEQTQRRWWPIYAFSCASFGFLWAITLLTYLLPPQAIWGGLLQGTLTVNQSRFILIAGSAFTLELLFARHLFCRFGCAVGLFQSLAWMANPRALVVAFKRERASDCRTCSTEHAPAGSACDSVCPMRLRPRQIKRLMFSCVQCGRCVDQCAESQQGQAQLPEPQLEWTVGLEALRETLKQQKQAQQHNKSPQ